MSHPTTSPSIPPHLKNVDEFAGALLASVTIYTIYETILWAVLSGLVGGFVAHFYRLIIAPLVERLLLKLHKKLFKNNGGKPTTRKTGGITFTASKKD